VFKSKATIEGKEQIEKQKRHEQTLIGAKEEEKIFKEMQNSMKSHSHMKNTVVFNGWKDNGINNTVMREYNFLIICEPLHAIFHIESKTAFSTNNFKNAAEQLKSGLDFFQDKLPFPEFEKWSYVRVASFANMTQKSSGLCLQCQHFVFGPNWNFSTWWTEMTALLTTPFDHGSTETYTDIVKFLLHQMLMQKDCVTDSDITNYTHEKIERISTLENIFFWNNVQFSLLIDTAKKRAVFASTFGTGKTSCIRAKAEQLLKDKQKVVIVVFQDRDTSADSLLKKTYEIHFQDKDGQLEAGITIESIRGSCMFHFNSYKIDITKIISIK
jgi:hypothetical protein